jgi:two-component system cell cycle response regulator
MKILIAEDDLLTQKILEKNITQWGHEVVVTQNGQDAWQVLQQDGLRIALLDWMMPKIDGVELCKKIRQKKDSKYTYIILLTARCYRDDVIRGLSAGADDYMTKPLNFMELKARLQTGLRIIELEDKLLKTQKRIIEVASRDSLTNLWNRASILEFLGEELEQSLREKSPLCAIMMDVDHFKKVNDLYGHLVGDVVLTEIAACIKRSIRRHDKLGRYGGDEILIVLPHSGLNKIRKIAEQLRLAIAKRKIKTASGALSVTISLGCASSESFPRPSVDSLIRASDRALYKAKGQGRNRTVIHKEKILRQG